MAKQKEEKTNVMRVLEQKGVAYTPHTYPTDGSIDGASVAWNVPPYCVEGGYAGTDWRGIESHEYHMDGNTFHIGTTNSRPEYLDKALARTPEGEPYFLSVMIGTASEDAATYATEVKKYLESRNDGRKYVFVRTADLAATYRAYKGLPIK